MITPHALEPDVSVSIGTKKGSSYIRAFALTLALMGSLLPPIGGVSMAAFGILVALLLMAVDLVRYLPVVHPVVFYCLGLFSLLSISVIWTDPPNEYGRGKLLSLLTSTLFTALLAVLIHRKQDLDTLANVWPLLVLPIAIAAVLSFEGGRATAFGSNPIWVARALATGVMFILWQLWYSTAPFISAKSITRAGMALLLIVGILLTGSRGPLLGLLVGAAFLITFSNVQKTWRLLVLSYLVIAALAVLVGSGIVSSSRIFSSDGSGRGELLATSFDVIAHFPGGVGIGNIGEYWESHQNYPHNIFVEVTAEHGWIVGIIFAGFVLNTLIRVLRHSVREKYVMIVGASLLIEFVNVNVSGDLNARTFYLFLMLSLWVLFLEKKERKHAIGVHQNQLSSPRQQP